MRRTEEADKPVGGPGGFTLVFKQRYLLLIAMLVLVVQPGQHARRVHAEHADRTGSRAGASPPGRPEVQTEARIIGTLSGTGADLRQPAVAGAPGFFVSRHLQVHRRSRRAVHPAGHCRHWDTTAICALPVADGRAVGTKIFENSTDYSIQNTTRQALFLPTSREAKYKAKQAIDSFFVRFGDMLQAVVVFVGVNWP